ncbi:MAG: glycosyltransferase [Sporomusaceae bacterium]|jgi:glycosyltransferase involved in cell wall biosynthesis|nr:glycosyltransferase [Sporomusaceae bacterium]
MNKLGKVHIDDMNEKKLTIVCPTYNQEIFIGQTLQSFVMQKTKYHFEVIVSDDCSTDGTAEIVRQYAKQYPEIIKPIFRKKNLGFGKSGNCITTLSSANTEYVLICEGDDYFDDPLKIEKQLNFLEENPGYTICFHPVKVIFEHLNIPDTIFPYLRECSPKEREKLFTFASLLVKGNYISTNSVMYRWLFRGRKKITDVFPQDIMPGDYFLHLLHAREGKIGFIDEVMATYRRHSGGMWIDDMGNEEALYLKCGEKQLNFFVQVAKTFLEGEAAQQYRKKAVYNFAVELLLIFLKHKRFDKLQQLQELCPGEYETAIALLYNINAPINKQKENT